MANISWNYGRLIVRTDLPEDKVRSLLKDMNDITDNWGDYSTFLDVEDIKVCPNDIPMYILTFSGGSRWSFYSTIEWFTKDKKLMDLYKKYNVSFLQFTFIFNDIEQGDGIFNVLNTASTYVIKMERNEFNKEDRYYTLMCHNTLLDSNLTASTNKKLNEFVRLYFDECINVDEEDEEEE